MSASLAAVALPTAALADPPACPPAGVPVGPFYIGDAEGQVVGNGGGRVCFTVNADWSAITSFSVLELLGRTDDLPPLACRFEYALSLVQVPITDRAFTHRVGAIYYDGSFTTDQGAEGHFFASGPGGGPGVSTCYVRLDWSATTTSTPPWASPPAPAPPTLTDTDPDSPANDNNPRIKGTAEAGSTVRLYTNDFCFGSPAATGSAAEFGSPGLAVAVADDSTTKVYATATDAASNTSDCSFSHSFVTYVEDSTAPETRIDSGPTGPTGDSTPTFTFSSSEPRSSFRCRRDSGAFAACHSPHTTPALADGSHSFEVRASDAAGNTDTSPASRAFTVATTAPHPAADAPPGMALGGKTTQKLGTTISLLVSATTEDLWATASGNLLVAGASKSYRLTGIKNRFVARGTKATLKLKLPKKTQKAIGRALRRHKQVRAKLKVVVRDTAGNSATRNRTIKLKR